MSRGQHRFRHIRLTRLAASKIETHKVNAPIKAKALVRRDAAALAKIKAQLAAASGISADMQSWLSRQIGRPFSKLTAEEISAVVK